jgi:phosphatidylserine decarboxylase
VRIAPEGRPFVIAGIVLLALFAVVSTLLRGWWWMLPALWLPIALWVPWFFRHPNRSGPRGVRMLIAPADGKVVSVADVEEPLFIGGPARRVSVFMNVFSVHVNRYPATGTVALRHYEPGTFVNATLDKASEKNERMSLGIEATQGRILVRQIAGLVARRIVTDAVEGEEVLQGERMGLIRFGSRVDTFFPRDARTLVSVGDHTQAGVTPIAEWES